MFTNCVLSYEALHDGVNLSYHDPLIVKIQWDWKIYVPDDKSSRVFTNRPAWYKATTEHISLYKATLRYKMSFSVLLCNDFMCKDCQHADILNKYSNNIMLFRCCPE